MTDYAAVLSAVHPGAEWSISNNEYATLEWLSDTPKPSKKTLDDAWPQVQHDREVAAVEVARRARYQAETDGLFMEAWANANPGSQPDLAAWRQARNQIRADLPKPVKP